MSANASATEVMRVAKYYVSIRTMDFLMITVVEAANRSGRHRTTITRAFLAGRLKGIQDHLGVIYIDETDLENAFRKSEYYYGMKKTHDDDVYPSSMSDTFRYNDSRDHYGEGANPHRVDPNSPWCRDFVDTVLAKSEPVKAEGTRVLFWTDTHVAPGDNLDRIRWIANYVKMTKPDHVWHGGDLATFDSCSAHDPIGSRKDKAKPTILDDLDILDAALITYHTELGPTKIPHSFSEGNHEYRLKRFEDSRGVMEGSLYPRLKRTITQYGWNFNDYGVISFLDGVGFVHIPFNRMGKPYGSHSVMLRDLTHDLVFGHTHQFQKMSQPKLGEKNRVTLLNGGCTLPFGHVEDYAKLNPTGWDYGVIDMTVHDGRILDSSFISIPTLQRFYENR